MRQRTRERVSSCQTWSLNFNEISQNPRRLREDRVARGFHQRWRTIAIHVVDKEGIFRRGEWDKGAFGVVHVEGELEEPLNKF